MADLISDEGLKYLILGLLRGATTLPHFPIKVREVVDNFDEEGQIQSFTIVTESGLRYEVTVDFLGERLT